MVVEKRERGNILFLILLAIILFVALSSAVTSGMRGGNNAGAESAAAGAAAVTQYVTLIRSEVQRLMLVNGCTVANLDWRNNYYLRNGGSYVSTNPAPAVPKSGCAIFQAYGGTIGPPMSFEQYGDPKIDTSIGQNWKAGHIGFRWVNRVNELTDANDIAMLIVGLNLNVCSALLNPATRPVIPTDTYTSGTDANSPAPAAYTGAANVIDESVNLVGDFFATDNAPSLAGKCQIGAIVLPQ